MYFRLLLYMINLQKRIHIHIIHKHCYITCLTKWYEDTDKAALAIFKNNSYIFFLYNQNCYNLALLIVTVYFILFYFIRNSFQRNRKNLYTFCHRIYAITFFFCFFFEKYFILMI